MGERAVRFTQFIYWLLCDQVIIAIFKTLVTRNPCKSKKCLVRASCTVKCEKKLHYLKFCDSDGKIMFQRITASSIIFGVVVLVFGITEWYVYLF